MAGAGSTATDWASGAVARDAGSRIGLWGATGSGKTTMLAALRVALTQLPDPDDGWIVYPNDATSLAFLRRISTRLSQRVFPEATHNSVHELSLRLVRPPHSSWLRRLMRPSARLQEFDLTLLDVGGGRYGPDPADLPVPPTQPTSQRDDPGLVPDDLFDDTPDAGSDIERLVDHLAKADGIVYLFDPLRELDSQDTYEYLGGMLEQVVARAGQLGRLRDGRLPHYLAVCVNKIDHPEVFRRAYDGAYLSISDGDQLLPEIASADASDLFQELCAGQNPGSGPLVRGSIERLFHPGRVRYFGTSSVGFYVGPSGLFQVSDYCNVDAAGRIRSQLRPINVLEPFLWLTESIRRTPPPAARPPASRPPASDRGSGEVPHRPNGTFDADTMPQPDPPTYVPPPPPRLHHLEE